MSDFDFLEKELNRLTEENIELVRVNYELMEIIQAKNALIEKLEEINHKNLECLINDANERDDLRKKRPA